MAYPGQVIENPVSGERITFVETAATTDGELLAIELELPAGRKVPGMHVHPLQEESFEVLDGTMRFTKGFRKVVAEAGEVVVVPPGQRHDFGNPGQTPSRTRVEIRPALDMEQLFETTAALAEDGRTWRNGMPKPLELALFVRRFEREVRAPLAPPLVVRAVLAPLAWLARKRGRNARYKLEPAIA